MKKNYLEEQGTGIRDKGLDLVLAAMFIVGRLSGSVDG
jgi:hypothetical protein